MLVAGGLALPLAVLAPPPLRAAAIPPSGVLRFTVLRGGSPMGTHRFAFRQEGRTLRVDIAIDIADWIGPIPISRSTPRNNRTVVIVRSTCRRRTYTIVAIAGVVLRYKKTIT